MNILFIGNGFDKANNVFIEYKDFVDWFKDKGELKNKKEMALFSEEEYRNSCAKGELWSEFEKHLGFLIMNRKKNKSFISKINYIFEKWFDSNIEIFEKNFEKNIKIKDIIELEKIDSIISLNFTSTPNQFGFEEFIINSKNTANDFNTEDKILGKYVCLHKFNEGTKYVLGNDSIPNIRKEKFFEPTIGNNDGFSYFKKTLLNSIQKYNKVIFFGISFGESDLDLINFVKSLEGKLEIKIYYYADQENQKFKELFEKNRKISFEKFQ